MLDHERLRLLHATCMHSRGLDDAVATGNATTWSMDPINLPPPFARSCDRVDYMCVGQHHTLSVSQPPQLDSFVPVPR